MPKSYGSWEFTLWAGPEDGNSHRFVTPEGVQWDDLPLTIWRNGSLYVRDAARQTYVHQPAPKMFGQVAPPDFLE